MSNVSIIESIETHARRIADGQERVSPGMPLAFTEACSPGDCIWQGDLALIISGSHNPPKGYKLAKEPSVQLVPGNNVGAKHCLDSLEGVEIFLPKNWNEESMDGPFLRIKQERHIIHPTHGKVTIPAGFNIECGYQREYDKELERERRVRD